MTIADNSQKCEKFIELHHLINVSSSINKLLIPIYTKTYSKIFEIKHNNLNTNKNTHTYVQYIHVVHTYLFISSVNKFCSDIFQ